MTDKNLDNFCSFSLLLSAGVELKVNTAFCFKAFAVFCMLCAFFLVITRRLEFKCRRFGTLCLFHLHRQVDVSFYSHLPAYENGTECSETSTFKLQTPGNYPKESIHLNIASLKNVTSVKRLLVYMIRLNITRG